MTKLIRTLALVLSMCFALAACGAKPQTTPDASASSSAEESAGVVNPVRDVTAEEQVEQTNVILQAPEGAADLIYSVIDSDDPNAPIAELDFTLDGQQYFYRGQAKDGGDAETLAGMYYDWTETIEDLTVDYCPAAAYAVTGEEEAAVLVWHDIVPGVSYTLAAIDTSDTDTLLNIANAVFVPMQGDAEGDEDIEDTEDSANAEDSQGGLVLTTYEQVISVIGEAVAAGSDVEAYQNMGLSYLYAYPQDPEAPLGYTTIDLNDDGVEELLVGTAGENGMIYDAFAMEEGAKSLTHLLNSGERDRYYLCENGIIQNEYSNSAANSGDVFFQFDGIMLQVVDNIYYDGEADADNPWFYRPGDMDENDESQSITEANAKDIIEKYVRVPLELTPFG